MSVLPILIFIPSHLQTVQQPGIPFRVATLEASHGSYDPISASSTEAHAYDTSNGMPSNDWFEFHYQESLSSDTLVGTNTFAQPLRWQMLSRNQIFHAHTENWVIRYLLYEPIDSEEERVLWENWFDLHFNGDCTDDDGEISAQSLGDRNAKMNRLSMLFSTSSNRAESGDDSSSIPIIDTPSLSEFDMFLTRHNKHYPHAKEHAKRKSIHDANIERIEMWNREHSGRTVFVPNEFLDLEVDEVMSFRGGHIPASISRVSMRSNLESQSKPLNNLRRVQDVGILLEEEDDESNDDVASSEEHQFTVYELPTDFDASTLPKEFDWRSHLPESVGPIQDQGFCGS